MDSVPKYTAFYSRKYNTLEVLLTDSLSKKERDELYQYISEGYAKVALREYKNAKDNSRKEEYSFPSIKFEDFKGMQGDISNEFFGYLASQMRYYNLVELSAEDNTGKVFTCTADSMNHENPRGGGPVTVENLLSSYCSMTRMLPKKIKLIKDVNLKNVPDCYTKKKKTDIKGAIEDMFSLNEKLEKADNGDFSIDDVWVDADSVLNKLNIAYNSTGEEDPQTKAVIEEKDKASSLVSRLNKEHEILKYKEKFENLDKNKIKNLDFDSSIRNLAVLKKYFTAKDNSDIIVSYKEIKDGSMLEAILKNRKIEDKKLNVSMLEGVIFSAFSTMGTCLAENAYQTSVEEKAYNDYIASWNNGQEANINLNGVTSMNLIFGLLSGFGLGYTAKTGKKTASQLFSFSYAAIIGDLLIKAPYWFSFYNSNISNEFLTTTGLILAAPFIGAAAGYAKEGIDRLKSQYKKALDLISSANAVESLAKTMHDAKPKARTTRDENLKLICSEKP